MVKCRCCSSNSLSRLDVAGRSVQVLGLPALFERFRGMGSCSGELFDAVRLYNAIPRQLEAEYRQAVMRAFAEYRSYDPGNSSLKQGG